jgi:amino acid transporter
LNYRAEIHLSNQSQCEIGTAASQKSGLRRVLTLWDLVFYGIVLIQPIAAVPLFGIADRLSRGHVVTTILIAMIAMMLTAISYGRMATKYPTAGSAYTYVSHGLNAHLGFLAGWAMILDYLLIPVLNVIYGALTLARIISILPYWAWAAILSALITFLNVRGIKSTARTNIVLLVLMCGVIGAFMLLAIDYLLRLGGMGALFSSQPFYTPGATDLSSIATATSLAALTYIGFDGVTTLSEEVKNPEKNVLRATVLVCFITGVFSAAQVYLAQRVWPDYASFPNIETAFMDISRRVGGASLFGAMAFTLILASLGSGLGGQAGAARVLFVMGREGALPRKVFAHLGSANGVPTWNLWMIGIFAFAGSLLLNFERAAELLNSEHFLRLWA